MSQKLRCADCGDLSEQGTSHECWVRLKLQDKPLPLALTCPICEGMTYGFRHWQCQDTQTDGS